MNKQKLLERIESFKSLKDKWDSYDARTIYPEAIELAKRIVETLKDEENWFVAPMSDGNILFEKDKKEGSSEYITITFLPKETT